MVDLYLDVLKPVGGANVAVRDVCGSLYELLLGHSRGLVNVGLAGQDDRGVLVELLKETRRVDRRVPDQRSSYAAAVTSDDIEDAVPYELARSM